MTVLLLDDQHIVSIGSQHNTRSLALSFHHLSSCWAIYSLAASGLAGSSSPLEIAVIWLLPSSIYFYKKKNNGVYINYYTKVLSLYKQLLLGGSCSLIDLAAEH